MMRKIELVLIKNLKIYFTAQGREDNETT